jgi:hypothetical protein
MKRQEYGTKQRENSHVFRQSMEFGGCLHKGSLCVAVDVYDLSTSNYSQGSLGGWVRRTCIQALAMEIENCGQGSI